MFGSQDKFKDDNCSTDEDVCSRVEVPNCDMRSRRSRDQLQVMRLGRQELRKRWRAHSYRTGADDFGYRGFTCWGLDENSIYCQFISISDPGCLMTTKPTPGIQSAQSQKTFP